MPLPGGCPRLAQVCIREHRPERFGKTAVLDSGKTLLIADPRRADVRCMERRNDNIARSSAHAEAETAVAVAERGLDSWRAAKLAWLHSFAAFAAHEAAAAPTASTFRAR